MSSSKKNVSVAFVVKEGEAKSLVAEVIKAGGHTTDEPSLYDVPIEQAELFGDQQFEPLIIIAASLGIGFLINRIAKVWRAQKHPGGVIVDARVTPPILLETDALDHGEVLLIRKDGSESFYEDRKDEALETIRALFGGHV